MSKKLWGGRFGKKTDPLVEEFTKSVHFDKRLAAYDVVGSMAHVKILKKSGYLKTVEASRLLKALASVQKSVAKGVFKPGAADEDIHTAIQNTLQKKVGDLALKLHTARSRNDQVAVATKLYCKVSLLKAEVAISGLIDALAASADKNKRIIMPGFTHLQHAQPVYLKDHLGAYIEMLKRDIGRLQRISAFIKVTMGSGALAGTPINAASYFVKGREIGGFGEAFDISAAVNALDAVSDRDFVIEILSALAITGVHLSRFSEDLVIWSTKEFGFVDIDDAFCTGSSLMPQKRNPDVLELARGYAGRLCGNLVSVLTTMKGLPLTYNRDMQLDKEPLFDSFRIVLSEAKVLTGLVKTLKFNAGKIGKQLEDESLYATDLVYYLVKKGIAFKNAHTIVGKLVKYSADKGVEIKHMAQADLGKFSDKLVKREIVKLFDPKVSVESKRSIKR
ncbi:MAG: argininosuccinate lyase [Candidatus Omnitrophica bacterium]|nr:argininosuccinate lyase [Candidatus Omnitrophota bacterium]